MSLPASLCCSAAESLGRGCLLGFGSAVFAEARLMGETFDCANWFSVKGKVGSSLGQQSSNPGDGGAAHCG